MALRYTENNTADLNQDPRLALSLEEWKTIIHWASWGLGHEVPSQLDFDTVDKADRLFKDIKGWWDRE